MDITMPQMEGIERWERHRAATHPSARIVMVSSVGYQENILGRCRRREAFCAEAGEAGSAVRNFVGTCSATILTPSAPPVAFAGEHRS